MWHNLDHDRKSVFYDLILILSGGVLLYSYFNSAHFPNPPQAGWEEIAIVMGSLLTIFGAICLLLDLRKIAKNHQ